MQLAALAFDEDCSRKFLKAVAILCALRLASLRNTAELRGGAFGGGSLKDELPITDKLHAASHIPARDTR